jgi:hypothetical protein
MKLLKSRHFRAMKMHQNFELWVSVFDDDTDPAPENVPSLTSKNPNECTNCLWNSFPYCDCTLYGVHVVHPTLFSADEKPTVTQIKFRPFLANKLVHILSEA